MRAFAARGSPRLLYGGGGASTFPRSGRPSSTSTMGPRPRPRRSQSGGGLLPAASAAALPPKVAAPKTGQEPVRLWRGSPRGEPQLLQLLMASHAESPDPPLLLAPGDGSTARPNGGACLAVAWEDRHASSDTPSRRSAPSSPDASPSTASNAAQLYTTRSRPGRAPDVRRSVDAGAAGDAAPPSPLPPCIMPPRHASHAPRAGSRGGARAQWPSVPDGSLKHSFCRARRPRRQGGSAAAGG